MGAGCDWMRQASEDFFYWIYPKKIETPDCVRSMLERIYPTVDWDTVTFHEGMPWVIGLGDQNAITLPGTYDLHHIDIYFQPGDWDPCTCYGLSIIVHESFHVLQYRDLADGWGLGFLRPFIIAYLSCSPTGGGGSSNVIEQPAYNQDARFLDCCNAIAPSTICDCSTTPPTFDPAALDALAASCPDVVRTSSGLRFWETLWECTPGLSWLWQKARELVIWGCSFDWRPVIGQFDPTTGGPQPDSLGKAVARFMVLCTLAMIGGMLIWLLGLIYFLLWFIIWTVITLIIAVLKPIVEIILLIVDGILWVVTGIVCVAEWLWDQLVQLWNWFRAQLARACTWATTLEQQCVVWETTRTQECTATEDQGYNDCTREEDQGYNRCTQEEDQGHRDCCTWAPCSWLCDSWVWVSHIVCVGWTWVSHIVCVTWTWVSHVVCVAWTWIVTRTCQAFTWVVKALTCW